MLTFLLLSACTLSTPSSTSEETRPRSAPARGVKVDSAPLLPELLAPLPVPDAQGALSWGSGQPPQLFVFNQLSAGNAEMLGRLDASLSAAEVPPELALKAWGDMQFRQVSGCESFLALATREGAYAQLYWRFAAHGCGLERWAGLESVPADAQLERAIATVWFPEELGEAAWTPELEAALTARAQSTEGFNLRYLAQGAMLLGAPPAALMKVHGAMTPEAAESFAAGFKNSADPGMRAAYCAGFQAKGRECPEPYVATPPGGGQGLEACARGEGWEAQECLAELAAQDRAKAVAIAQGEGGESVLADALIRWPQPGQLQAEMVRIGLLDASAPASPSALTPGELLMAQGVATEFDTETGMFPNAHDVLLAELASLAGPDLEGAVFYEIPPPVSEKTGMEEGDYTLHGWHDGHHAQIQADGSLGDWYDVAAVLELLDALLIAGGSDKRVIPLESLGQTLPVVVATPEAAKAGAEAGVFTLGNPDAARAAGKAFEDQVFEQLKAQGEDVQRDVMIEVGE